MNRQIIFALVFIFSCMFNLNAQERVPTRTVPADAQVSQLKGEALDFQKVLRRYETAIKENDVQSARELQTDLESAMEKRVEKLEKEGTTEKQTTDLAEQRKILDEVKAFRFTGEQEDYKTTLANVRKIQRFARLMGENF